MICIAWSGFPQYAARCVGSFVKSLNERVIVIATRPAVPICGMEDLVGCEIKWIDNRDSISVNDLLPALPRVLVVTGWGVKPFNQIRDAVRANGGRIVCMVDNNYRFSVKEIVKAIRFRLLLKNKYDSYFVPGNAGIRLLSFYGVPTRQIRVGLYSADSGLFTRGEPLSQREKIILFVGQLNQRKNIVNFTRAFLSIKSSSIFDWKIHIYGCGPLRGQIPVSNRIVVHNFSQPEELARVYRGVRCFVLPSVDEHWGVVVHEASLSGCLLMLSDRVGAAADFAGMGNVVTFNPFSMRDMRRSILAVIDKTGVDFDKAYEESLRMGSMTSVSRFVSALQELVK